MKSKNERQTGQLSMIMASILVFACQCAHQNSDKPKEANSPISTPSASEVAIAGSSDEIDKALRKSEPTGSSHALNSVDQDNIVSSKAAESEASQENGDSVDYNGCLTGNTDGDGCIRPLGGWLAPGVDEELILKKIGKPEATDGEYVYISSSGEYQQIWNYPSKGVQLTMLKEELDAPASVNVLTISHPCEYETPEGIGIGTESAIAEKIYQKSRSSDYSNESRHVIGTIYWGTLFYFKDGKVNRIVVGASVE